MTLNAQLYLVNLVRHGDEGNIETDLGATITAKGTFLRLTWENLVNATEPVLALHLQDETMYFRPAFASLDAPGDP